MQQLDGTFGAARGGGYNGSTWLTDYPYKRGTDENIRTWGQLGFDCSWINKPIHPCGQTPKANIQDVFQNLAMRGSDQWVEGMRTFANYATLNRTIATWSSQVRNTAISDPLSICVASPEVLVANDTSLKVLDVQGFNGVAFVSRTLETVRSRSYPLINSIFFYANKEPGQHMEPKAYEFLRFILSQEGQQEVQHEGRYLPLPGSLVATMRNKLEPNST
jgi:phosphate transport system substrate-binding protein